MVQDFNFDDSEDEPKTEVKTELPTSKKDREPGVFFDDFQPTTNDLYLAL